MNISHYLKFCEIVYVPKYWLFKIFNFMDPLDFKPQGFHGLSMGYNFISIIHLKF